jgi:hypothetical protein
MLQGCLACMCRFTYGLLTEDGLSNLLSRNVCLVYMTSMSKVTLWLCVLEQEAQTQNQNDAMTHSDKKKRHCSVTLGPRAHFNTVQESL